MHERRGAFTRAQKQQHRKPAPIAEGSKIKSSRGAEKKAKDAPLPRVALEEEKRHAPPVPGERP